MKQEGLEKAEISVELINEKMNQTKLAFMERNAEIRKIMKGDFKLERVLAAQREFEIRVLEFRGMIKSFYSSVKVECADEKGKNQKPE